jgi:hypothetical protein
MTAFKPDAQTLLTVVQTVESSSPAPSAHCLAGFCPTLYKVINMLFWDSEGSHKAQLTLQK